MTDRSAPSASGALLALAVLAGGLIGAILGEPSDGIVLGVVVGGAICLALWLRDRARG